MQSSSRQIARGSAANDNGLHGLSRTQVDTQLVEGNGDTALKAVENAIETALLSCHIDVQKLDFLGAILRFLRVKQTEVMLSSDDNTAAAAMDRSSWSHSACEVVYLVLCSIPVGDKADANGVALRWYLGAHSFLLASWTCSTIIFWRKVLVMERLVYMLKCPPVYIILGYAHLGWGVSVAYLDAGWEMVDPVSASSYLVACVLILTLDACDCTLDAYDCSRRFHVVVFTIMFCSMFFECFTVALLRPDTVILEGTGWGNISVTKNGIKKVGILAWFP
jgi:hypothetical protein